MSAPTETLHAFDQHAQGYGAWEQHRTAQSWRARVIAACAERLPAGGRVLDIGGGTGLDAAILGALGFEVVVMEPSDGMRAVARARGVRVVAGGVSDLAGRADLGAFDLALSDFGALNCVADLEPLRAGLTARLRAGGVAVLVVMAPFALGEAAVMLARGRVRALARRRRSVVQLGGRRVPVTWWTARTLARSLPGFELTHVEALGCVAPPPDLHAGGSRLSTWDRRVGALPGLRHLGDHALCVFQRPRS